MKTRRLLLALTVAVGLTAIVSAQDRGQGDQDKKNQPEQPKDALFRVGRDMQSAEERLGKSDPGDVTRKIQRDIIDGLDELIKQNNKSEGGQSNSSKMKQQAADAKKKKAEKQNQQDQAKDGKGDNQDEKKDKNTGKSDDFDKDKDGGKQGGGQAKDDKSAKTDNTSDLFRMDWGHLPLTKRQEMDAYSKERFMPRYDDVLQQYYRNIAEQGQKKVVDSG